MYVGQQITVKGGTFPKGREGTIKYVDKYGAIVEIPGMGSFYIQSRYGGFRGNVLNYGNYFIYGLDGEPMRVVERR